LDLLRTAPELRDELLRAIQARREDAAAPGVAEVLQAALQWEAGQRDAASRRMRDALQRPRGELPPALVGQVAQRWQAEGAAEELMTPLDDWLLAVPLPADWNSFRDGIPRRVLARLRQSDRREEARDFLLEGFYGRYPECRFATVRSPGDTAGLQETTLEEGRFVADQLEALGFAVDALRIQRGLLARLQPERSDLREASPLEQASLTVRKLSDAIDALSRKLIDQEADALGLPRTLDQLLPTEAASAGIDLLVDVPPPWTGRSVASVTSGWLDRAAATPAGRTLLQQRQRELAEADASGVSAEVRLAMQSWIALALSSAEAAENLRGLVETLQRSDASASPGRLQWIALVERASKTAEGNTPDEATIATAEELAWQLLPQAAATGADNHLLRLAERLLAKAAAERREEVLAILRDRLDQQVPARQTPLPLEASRAAFALAVSRLAWQADDPQLALEAADRALAGGAPRGEQASRSEVSGVDLGSGDLDRRARSPERLLAQQAATLAGRWQKAVRGAPASKLARRIEQTLAGWVFPPGEEGNMRFYLVATSGTPLALSPAVPRPPSAFAPWLEIAIARGEAAELPARWRQRSGEGPARTDALTADLVWAMAAGQADQGTRQAERLAEQMGVTLPSWSDVQTCAAPAGPLTPTIAKRKAAARKLELADRLLLVRPRLDDEGTAEGSRLAACQRLRLRTVAMLLLDQTASRKSLSQLEWVTAEIVAHQPEGGDAEVARTARHLQTLIHQQLAEETP